MVTNLARIASPRSVWMIHRVASSSHTRSVIWVENNALSYSPNVVAIRFAWAWISGANTYFIVGMCPVSSSSGR